MLNKLYRKKDLTKPADTKYLPKMSYTKYIKSLKWFLPIFTLNPH